MIGEYIKSATGKAFAWGAHDCSTFAADWLVLNGQPDPMADIRGKYCDELSAYAFIKSGGGLLQLWCDRMPKPSANTNEGAVGIVNMNGEHIMGIYAGPRWVFLMDSGIRGVTVTNKHIVRAWNLG